MRNVLMAISGPSGVGKGTLVKALLKKRADVVASVSCTTRAPRENEREGKDYFFLTREEFLARVGEGAFLEYDEHFGNFYGTPKAFVEETLKEKSVILEIDVVGAQNAKKAFPQCILVMIVPPSEAELRARLEGRNSETEEEIKTRLARFDYELSQKRYYDHVVVNDSLDGAVCRLEEILDSEKNK